MSLRLSCCLQAVPLLVLALLAPLLLSGCQKNVYELTMSLDGNTMERELVCYRTKTGGEGALVSEIAADRGSLPPLSGALVEFPKEELARIAAVYGKDVSAMKGKRHVFKGTFMKRAPEDVGGAGYHATFANPLGKVAWYSERFRGESDVAGRVQKGFRATDRLSEVLIGWLSTELGEEPWWPELRRFVTEELRQDVKNLLLYAWLVTSGDVEWKKPAERTRAMTAIAARFAQFAAERGYVTPDEVPTLFRIANSGVTETEGSRAAALVLARTVVGRKLKGVDANLILGRLVSLFATDAYIASLQTYLKTTKEWQELHAKWEKNRSDDPKAVEPEVGAVAAHMAMDIAPFFLPVIAANDSLQWGGVFQIKVKLNTESAPTHTNGSWDAETKQVTWNGDAYAHASPASFAYATWVVPNVEAQKKLFGGVLLDGEELTKYSIWHAGLNTSEAKEWAEFLATAKPGDDLSQRIEAVGSLGGDPDLLKVPQKIFGSLLDK